GSGRVHTAQAARVVPELPRVVGRVGIRTARGAEPPVEAHGDVVRDQIHDATQRGRSVQRRAGALHHLDVIYVGDRDHVPIDATAVALVRRHAVHELQYARPQAFDEPARAPNVDLTAE